MIKIGYKGTNKREQYKRKSIFCSYCRAKVIDFQLIRPFSDMGGPFNTTMTQGPPPKIKKQAALTEAAFQNRVVELRLVEPELSTEHLSANTGIVARSLTNVLLVLSAIIRFFRYHRLTLFKITNSQWLTFSLQ